MNLNNLKNPFIIYWDINSAAYSDDIISRICDDLIETKIFLLHIRDLSAPASITTLNVLKKLAGSNIKITLTAGVSLKELSTPKILKGHGLSCLYIETESIEQVQAASDNIAHDNLVNPPSPPSIKGGKGGFESSKEACVIGVSFCLNKKNFMEVPAVISFCVKNNLKELTFPIQRAGEGEIFYPVPEDLTRLSDELKAITTGRLKITIHDPFIWKVFNEKDNPEGTGCNGANTMAYISENLDVTPCPLLPVRIGSLHSQTLREIFLSDERLHMRKCLSTLPAGCLECPIVNKCKGGCRGRAYVLYKAFDRKDPACNFKGALSENTHLLY